MGQYWNIVCMDNKRSTGCIADLGEFFRNRDMCFLIKQITKHVTPRSTPLPVKTTEAFKTKLLSPLENLPVEVINTIFSFMGTMDSILCLSLVCYRFLQIGRRSIFVHLKADVSAWAGKRIICVGDYTYDYPEGFLTQKEQAEIAGAEGLFNYASDFRRPEKNDTYYIRALQYTCKVSIGYRLLDEMLPFIGYKNYPVYVSSSKHILRNLTTKEYIRASEITTPSIFDFEQILLLQICWSSDKSTSIDYLCNNSDIDLYRGPWAGHRFDITTIDKVDSSWKDVSIEVITKIKPIIDAED